VTEVPGTVAHRKGLEAVAITRYRAESGQSPLANFGGMPAGNRKSTGNNARLAASGRRARGGPDPAAPARPASAPVARGLGTDPASGAWMTWPWSSWTPVAATRALAPGTGLYRLRRRGTAGLLYVGQGAIADRLRVHAAKAAQAGHRQAGHFSGDVEASWIAWPGAAPAHLLEHENDLIAAHVLALGHAPAAQFLG
jgi:hypothetical protein